MKGISLYFLLSLCSVYVIGDYSHVSLDIPYTNSSSKTEVGYDIVNIQIIDEHGAGPIVQIHPHRAKRWVVTAIVVGIQVVSFIFQGIANSKMAALQREAAEQAARHFREQNKLKLQQICSSICVTEWGPWSHCSKPCGTGVATRTRELQSIGVCSELENFKCPYENSRTQPAMCNIGCPNGGTPSETGCACPPGYKGQCCTEESHCPYPGKPKYGKVSDPSGGWPARHRDVVQFSCDEGFTLIGEDYAFCNHEQWSNSAPTCKVIQCVTQGPNAHIELLNPRPSFMFGETLYYTCETGYKLVGPASRTCEMGLDESGRWSGFNPSCDPIKCQDPYAPVNGQKNGTDFGFGKSVIFSCKEGYRLIGSQQITCSDQGQWIGNIPICEIISCDAPLVPRNGEIAVRSQRYGSVALFTCLPGYQLKGPDVIFCSTEGAWNDTEPTCQATICPDPGSPKNGYKDGTLYYYPHNVTFGCFQGYQLVGQSKASCLESGMWSSPAPQCVECAMGEFMQGAECLRCPENSNTTTTASTVIQQCRCNAGYYGPAGGPCQEITCSILVAPPFGKISNCKNKVGSRCNFSCDDGFIIERGSSIRTCQDNGDWDGTDPFCSPCPLDTYQHSELQCLPCPMNSHTTAGAQTLTGCICNAGYQGANGGPCSDLDECTSNGGRGSCEDVCENTVGSYVCRCTTPGYELDTDKHSCKVNKQCTNLTSDDAPANGGLVCHWFREENSQQCSAKCDNGFEFPARINNYELCGPTTGYQWSFKTEDPDARFEPCIEEFFPDVRLEAESSYFVTSCHDLTQEEQRAVKEQFAQVLNDNNICKSRQNVPLCQIQDMAIICGRTTRRRRRTTETSMDFAFNITALHFQVNTAQCPEICQRLKIFRDCENLCVPTYKRYIKAAMLYSQQLMQQAFNSTSKHRMDFYAAKRLFKAEGAVLSDMIAECEQGMKDTGGQCVPCFPGTYYSAEINDCLLCANGTYQPLFSQEQCYTCPNGTYSSGTGAAFCLVCDEHHWGSSCQHECGDCKHGRCNPLDGTCLCDSGWQGPHCSIDTDGCAEMPCFQGVTCSDVPAPGTGFSCGSCPLGYHGNGIVCDPSQ